MNEYEPQISNIRPIKEEEMPLYKGTFDVTKGIFTTIENPVKNGKLNLPPHISSDDFKKEKIHEKIFCSFPMHGRSLEDVEIYQQALFDKALLKLIIVLGMKIELKNGILDITGSDDYDITLIDNIHKENVPDNAGRIWYLGDSIKLMENATFVVFDKDWENSKGCCVEMEVCKQYGKRYIIEGVDF